MGADQVDAGELDAVVGPGGWAPDKIRRYESVTELVHQVYQRRKIVASICHGGLVLISAGIVGGHRATGSEGIKDDLINAGASWTYDEEAFRDGNIVWGRVVPDIPAFCRELIRALSD
jgi:protease I